MSGLSTRETNKVFALLRRATMRDVHELKQVVLDREYDLHVEEGIKCAVFVLEKRLDSCRSKEGKKELRAVVRQLRAAVDKHG